MAQRWFFLIDKDGIVRGEWSGTTKDVFPSETILEVAKKVSAES